MFHILITDTRQMQALSLQSLTLFDIDSLSSLIPHYIFNIFCFWCVDAGR